MVQPYAMALQRGAVRTWSAGGTLLSDVMCQNLRRLNIIEATRGAMGRHFRCVHTSPGRCNNRGSSGNLLWRWLPGQVRDAVLSRTRRRDKVTTLDELVYSSTVGTFAFWSQIVVYGTCAPVALALSVEAYRSYSERGATEEATRPLPSRRHSRNDGDSSVLAYFDIDDAGPLKPVALLVALALVAVVRVVARRAVWRIYYNAKQDSFTAILPGLIANRRVVFLPGEVRSFPEDAFGNHAINGSRCIIAPQSFKDNAHYNHMVGW